MKPSREPFAARLHGFALFVLRPQRALVDWRRRDLERAPHWVLLTTRGRRSGLPREVLLPCARRDGRVLVISTYARRSAWLRNIEACAAVTITSRGERVAASAAIVDDLAQKCALVGELPFVPLLPLRIMQKLARGALKPLVVRWLRRWVAARPVVLIEARSAQVA